MRVVIVANAPERDHELVLRETAGADLIIATDGAIDDFPEGISPHVVSGDLDSIADITRVGAIPGVEIVSTPDQELSDLEKAVLIATARGATSVRILWAFSGRLDHSIATLSILIRYHQHILIEMVHRHTRAFVLSSSGDSPKRGMFDAEAGDLISILPLSPSAQVRVTNVQWPLHGEEVFAGSRGVSNVATGGEVLIEVARGMVVVCHEYGR